MELIITHGFLPVFLDFNRKEALRKGKEIFKGNHVKQVKEQRRRIEKQSVEEDAEQLSSRSLITAKVLPQTKVNNALYAVEIKIDASRNVTHASCTCKAGLGQRCKHILAVVSFVNSPESTASKTSGKQQWGIPTPSQLEKYKKGIQIRDLFKPKGKVFLPPKSKVLPTVPMKLFNINCAFKTIMQPEDISEIVKDVVSDVMDQVVENQVMFEEMRLRGTLINEIVLRQDTFTFDVDSDMLSNLSYDKQLFYKNKISLSLEEIKNIANETSLQSENDLWAHVRDLRISASSKAHRVKTRKGDYDNLASDFLHSKIKNKPASMIYGSKLESKARTTFEILNNCIVGKVGVIVSKCLPWLCCSPDGLYFEQGDIVLLEIKCPYKCRNDVLYDDENGLRVKYLKRIGDKFVLSKSHCYYTQIQISLFVTCTFRCVFFVYSPKQTLQLIVHRDEEYLLKIIPKLHQFYYTFYLDKLLYKYGEIDFLS